MDGILKVNSILKQFGQLNAVNYLSFEIQRCEIFALLGPNGAGKTTTVRMLTNIIKPDEGSIEYFLQDKKPSRIPLASELGYLPEERGLYQEIPIIRYIMPCTAYSNKVERVNISLASIPFKRY